MWVGSQRRYGGGLSHTPAARYGYASYGSLRLSSPARYSHYAPGVLPSASKTARLAPTTTFAQQQSRAQPYAALGSIRYATASSFTPAYTPPLRVPTVATAGVALQPSAATQTPAPATLYAAQGTIRYGTTNTSFSKALAQSTQLPSSPAAKTVVAADLGKSKPSLRTPQGSMRYGHLKPTTPVTTTRGFVPTL